MWKQKRKYTKSVSLEQRTVQGTEWRRCKEREEQRRRKWKRTTRVWRRKEERRSRTGRKKKVGPWRVLGLVYIAVGSLEPHFEEKRSTPLRIVCVCFALTWIDASFILCCVPFCDPFFLCLSFFRLFYPRSSHLPSHLPSHPPINPPTHPFCTKKRPLGTRCGWFSKEKFPCFSIGHGLCESKGRPNKKNYTTISQAMFRPVETGQWLKANTVGPLGSVTHDFARMLTFLD